MSKNLQGQPVPEFSITVATSEAVKVDPLTGVARPAETEVLKYQLESGMVKRVAQPGAQSPTPASDKAKPAVAHSHHHRGKGKAAGG